MGDLIYFDERKTKTHFSFELPKPITEKELVDGKLQNIKNSLTEINKEISYIKIMIILLENRINPQ